METPSSSPNDSGAIPIGTVIADRYRIVGLLGVGGMGRVFRAEHTAMGKPVAIKVLHAALGRNQEAATRFQREAIASGRLDHPNIVSVTDFGVLADGCLYLVMEALEGEHLGQRLDRDKQIPWPEALAIMRGVLLGLRHAHDRGVVHRDIKPDNIFLASKDGEGIVKVLDFGIAKLYAETTDDQTATRVGITVGTPKYLSPEQAVGGAITPASDVYSASVVLYEMLVGRAPFEYDEPLALMTAHVGGEVPTFETVAPTLEVPTDLEDLVRQGLAKIAAERIGSALEYVQRIDEILRANGIDVPATPMSARPSQPMGIAVGPYAISTPVPGRGRTPARGVLPPSPNFLATPMPFPVLTPSTPAPTAAADSDDQPTTTPAATSSIPPRRRRMLRIGIALGTALLLAATAGSLMLYGDDKSVEPSRSSQPVAVAPVAIPAPKRIADDHETRFKAALQTLENGATCLKRKKAIPILVELGDATAIAALKKARARGKANGCLVPVANQAIKTLGAK